jgi:predicted molibdopterin-dependent oxidoreductase YjgC
MSAPATLTIHVDGRAIRCEAGMTLAAALLNAGVTALRTSVTGEPRAPLCGMGTCFECRVEIDGAAHQRACMIDVRDGMQVRT